MATRLKTVQFAFPMYTSTVPDTTTTNLSQITIYIPESVTAFRSVTVDVGFQDIITATGGTITEQRVGLRLGAATYDTVTETDDITQSGEQIAGITGPFDFTSYFTTNWTGNSQTCDLQVYFDQSSGTTRGMRNVTAVVIITYEFDDSATDRLKTAWIPLECLTADLPTAANSNFGTNQIPQMTGSGGMLPESGVTIRDYYFVIEGNETTDSATDFTITANIDSGTATAFGTQESALNSSRYCRWIYKPGSVPTLGSSHNLQLWSDLAGRCYNLAVTLVVTYQFTPATTTTVLNSMLLPIEMTGPLGSNTASDASRVSRDIYVNEPSTINLMQSGFRINYNCSNTPTGLRFRAGGQAYRAYTTSVVTASGMYSLQQRIDTAADKGSGFTITRGKNTLVIDGYLTTTSRQATNVNGYIILNYHSGMAAVDPATHNHTIMYNLLQWDAANTDRNRIDNYSINLPESQYFFNGVGFVFYQFVRENSMGITFDTQCLTNEARGGGYYDIYSDSYQSDNERANSIIWMRGRDVFLRYPNDPGADRVDFQQARSYRLFTSTATANGLMAVPTYNSISFTVSGNITGSNGGLVNIRIYRGDSDELVRTTSRTGDGSYSFEWHDDTIDLYAVAYEDTDHRGRSVNATAGTSLDVSLSRPIVRSYA